MLVYSYAHTSGQVIGPTLASTPPTNPTGGNSHVALNTIPGFNQVAFLQSVRFTCTTTAHARKVNFYYTSNSLAFAAIMTGTLSGNALTTW